MEHWNIEILKLKLQAPRQKDGGQANYKLMEFVFYVAKYFWRLLFSRKGAKPAKKNLN
jgi:hypothetical protein